MAFSPEAVSAAQKQGSTTGSQLLAKAAQYSFNHTRQQWLLAAAAPHMS
jgi:hypothetical protein